jgi:hypothetical protein
LSESFKNTKIVAKTWAKTEIFAKIFEQTKIFAKTFAKQNFAKASKFSLILASRENEKRGFRFNPKLTLFINMLKLDKITISESRVA